MRWLLRQRWNRIEVGMTITDRFARWPSRSILAFVILHLFLLFLTSLPLAAQGGEAIGTLSSLRMVRPEVRMSQNLLPAGSSMRGAILLNLESGWHVNAHRPSMEYLIGTDLQFQEREGIRISRITYPSEREYRFDFAPEPVAVYEGDAPIFFTLTASEQLPPGEVVLEATLRVQACNNEVCLAPATLDLTIPVEISAAGTGYQLLDRSLFERDENGSGSITDALSARGSGEIEALFDSLGFFWAMVGIFLVGLALNLTPCVYPMLSVTVSLFGGQTVSEPGSASRLGHSFLMALIYVLGIVGMYSVLGVAAAFTGSLFGSWMQSPVVLAGIGILIFALALSMFGLYELQPPSSWLQSLGGAQRKASGVFGHFFSGLVVGVFAAPCIGPPIIALLAFVGAQGDPLFGFLIFFVMAFGLGFPYLILGTFSGLLSRLPRSGIWMVWVKKVFGVVLTGVALFYLALAFKPSWSLHAVILTLLAGGIYLGFVERSGRDTRIFYRVKQATGVILLIAGILLIRNLQKPGIVWEEWSEEKLAAAVEGSAPVLIDFYADWCIPCLELERTTYTDPRVIAESERFVRLKADLTHYDSPESEALRERFAIAGVPTVLFLDRGGEEVVEARVVGYLRADHFLERLRMVPHEETPARQQAVEAGP